MHFQYLWRWFIAAFVTLAPAAAIAQTASVIFAEDITEVTVTDAAGNDVLAQIGMEVGPGSSIRTGSTGVELEFSPSRSIVRMAEETLFTVDELIPQGDLVEHRFGLRFGKIRTVVVASQRDLFIVTTPTAVAGVRGTDFAQRVVPGEMDWVCVMDGEVEFTRVEDSTTVTVTESAFADTFNAQFRSQTISQDRLDQLFSDVQFRERNPRRVRRLPPRSLGAGRPNPGQGGPRGGESRPRGGAGGNRGGGGPGGGR